MKRLSVKYKYLFLLLMALTAISLFLPDSASACESVCNGYWVEQWGCSWQYPMEGEPFCAWENQSYYFDNCYTYCVDVNNFTPNSGGEASSDSGNTCLTGWLSTCANQNETYQASGQGDITYIVYGPDGSILAQRERYHEDNLYLLSETDSGLWGLISNTSELWGIGGCPINDYACLNRVAEEEGWQIEASEESSRWSPPPPPPPTVNLNGPSVVEIPDPISLSWGTSDADSCSASGDWSGGKSTSGSETIKSRTGFSDRGNYSYSLTCSGPGGSASDDHTLQVVQVPRCTFIADPENIILPQFSTLSWECEYCDTAYINQGIGDVNCSGNQDVRPDKTTTYTFSANGLDGQRLYQAIVGVGFVPVLREVLPR